MYGINNSGKLFFDDLTQWLIEEGLVQYQFHMSIYYNYAPDGTNIVVLFYVDACVYCYTYEAFRKCFVDALGNIFHVKFLGCAHWFVSIRISHMKDHSLSVYQSRYTASIVYKYLDTATVNISTTFYNTNLTSGMIFTKYGASTSDEQVEKLTR